MLFVVSALNNPLEERCPVPFERQSTLRQQNPDSFSSARDVQNTAPLWNRLSFSSRAERGREKKKIEKSRAELPQQGLKWLKIGERNQSSPQQIWSTGERWEGCKYSPLFWPAHLATLSKNSKSFFRSKWSPSVLQELHSCPHSVIPFISSHQRGWGTARLCGVALQTELPLVYRRTGKHLDARASQRCLSHADFVGRFQFPASKIEDIISFQSDKSQTSAVWTELNLIA